jgi:hypothetical protein
MQEFINLTPHTVTVTTPRGDYIFPPSGYVARVDMQVLPAGELNGIPLVTVRYGAASLPEEYKGKNVIVSTMFADAFRASEISDQPLFVPDSGPSAIRENGQIKAVTSLIRK